MKSNSISSAWSRIRGAIASFGGDRDGIAATEFAVIAPVMLVMFFGTLEFSSGIAVSRKVTLMARTLSDLTSQSISVGDNDMTNFFAASTGVMTPYSLTPVKATITELYVDPATLVARVQWSKGAVPRAVSSTLAIPAPLANAGTYLIYSEVEYLYKPIVGYVMAKTGILLNDFAYTRPRQSQCVFYTPSTICTTL